MTDAFIVLEKVCKSYSRGGETLHVLDEFHLSIPESDFVALMGPSGSGKTTILIHPQRVTSMTARSRSASFPDPA